MNHCIQGGIRDGDGGEVDGEGSEERRAALALAVARGTPPAPPASIGVRRPLAPFLHGFLGALPNGDEIHGEGKKRGFGGWKFVVGGCPPRVRVSSLI